ncbi:UDP-glycosyltransferase 83A1-like [Andrographis paniculata]|uniref:UDP-glycosyltransferase 83A1-like n=1 Tax=Andrographis paniculata TaxID=175694 RepID=UPI0021E851B2|nr:UDP-glycosyltransferase 83A1-like [Andrographis paniculata]
MATKAHLIMVPFPAQGHVIPLLHLAQKLATRATITFLLNSDRLLRAADHLHSQIRLVPVASDQTPPTPENFLETLLRIIPARVAGIIEEEIVNTSVRCVVVYDQAVAGIGEVAEKFGVASAVFLPPAAAQVVLALSIPKLVEDGVIDAQGAPLTKNPVQLAAGVPAFSPSDFPWNRFKTPARQRLIFAMTVQGLNSIKSSQWTLCNSVQALEPGAFDFLRRRLSPAVKIAAAGPLIAAGSSRQLGHFQEPDAGSLDWLDQHQHGRVVYAAFGSTGVLGGKAQLRELALGLELTGKPFLWVVSGDGDGDGGSLYPEGFLDRVADRARIVRWAPQQAVLRHTAVACFVSHCGWNSAVEGAAGGVPMVCCPQTADQFMNQAYICDTWRMGVRVFVEDEEDGIRSGVGVVGGEEIKDKIEEAIGLKERALEVKEMVWREHSCGDDDPYKEFVTWVVNG